MRPSEGLVVDRRAFLGTLTGGLVAAPLAVGAQPAGKVAKIGYLTGSSVGPLDAFRQLGEHGYIEGQNIAIEALGLTIPPSLLQRADQVIE